MTRARPRNLLRRAANRLVYTLVAAFAGAYRRLGPSAGYRIAGVAGAAWFALFRRRRRIIFRNLDIAFGEVLGEAERERIGRLCCMHALAAITDLAVRERIVGAGNWPEYFTVDEVLEDALGSRHPRGLAILSAHLGSWEMGQFFCGLRGVPASPVVRTLDNPYLDRAAARARTRFGGEVIPKRGALFGIRRVLGAGGCVAIVADQSAPPGEYVYPFFGFPASVYASYASVLVRQRCRVIFSVCLREGFAFRFRFRSRELTAPADGSVAERAHALVGAYHRALEEAIRDSPEQYLWMHRKWKPRTPGEPSPYDERRNG